MRAGFRAGVATFQCSDAVVFVFVFAIPVCLDPCDPVDCGYSVPPCNSEPVWRNDLVSRMQMKQENPPVVSLTRQTLNKILDTDVNIFSFKGSKAKNTDSKFHPPTLLLFFIKLSGSPCCMCSCWSLSWKPLVSGSSSRSRLWSVMTSWPICLGSSLEELHWSRYMYRIMVSWTFWMCWCEITTLIWFHLSFFS